LLKHGGLDFDVTKAQLYDGLGRTVDAWGVFRIDRANAADESKSIFLGTVGRDYTPINHAVGFETIDALMGAKDGAHYETAGVLGKGEKVWGLADLNLSISVGDDKSDAYLLFATGHDGSMSHTYKTCMTRVVCQNTLSVAISEKSRASFVIRHTKNAGQRIIDVHQALAAMGDDVKRIEDRMNFLAGRKMTRESMDTLFDRLFPKTEKENDAGEKVLESSGRRDNILADVLKIYELNDGNAFPEQRGTALNALNAITNYVDHERGKGDTRAEAAMFGSGDVIKTRAYDYVLAMAPQMPQRLPLVGAN